MLLTDTLIDELHAFRVGTMARAAKALAPEFPSIAGTSIGSGYAIFAGDGSPLTQVYGVGHRDSDFDLAEIESFFQGKASNWELIVTPFTNHALLHAATNVGYVIDHFETVLAQHSAPQECILGPGIEIEEVEGDFKEWSIVSEAGWTGQEVLLDEPSELGKVIAAYPARRFLARIDGEGAATAALGEFEGKFVFSGASTRPQYRGRGLQTALTQHRLREAGVGSFVQVTALPGSQSHRNLQRIGFEPLYSKVVLYRRG